MVPYLNFEEQLITGKNIPSKLKLRNDPGTLMPLKVKLMIGIDRSSMQPMTSPFRMNGSEAPAITNVFLPP